MNRLLSTIGCLYLNNIQINNQIKIQMIINLDIVKLVNLFNW